jgi:2-polyprenyl-3-methyl-5-hydroxy-6-metoxy-1,4-benzoquinol methylase
MKSMCCCDTKLHVFSEYIRYRNETVFREYEGITIGKCTSCGLLRTFPPKRSQFDPKQSDAIFYEKNIDLFSRLFTPIIDGIQKYRQKGTVLDIGCSSGILLGLLKERGYDIFGIEPNIHAYTLARNKFGKTIYHGTVGTYKTTKKFDVVVLSHVLEHVEEPRKMILSIKKILSKNGIIVIGIPNTRNIIFAIRKKYWEYLRPNEHVWHFSDTYLISLMKHHGFHIYETWYMNDSRSGYPWVKGIYFRILCFINDICRTGETVSIICRNDNEKVL